MGHNKKIGLGSLVQIDLDPPDMKTRVGVVTDVIKVLHPSWDEKHEMKTDSYEVLVDGEKMIIHGIKRLRLVK